jgi:hypothetical protein
MHSRTNHVLKIADTPSDWEDQIREPEVDETKMISEESTSPEPSTQTQSACHSRPQSQRPGGRGGVRRFSPEAMDIEIDRVQRLNGKPKPTLARGTDPD